MSTVHFRVHSVLALKNDLQIRTESFRAFELSSGRFGEDLLAWKEPRYQLVQTDMLQREKLRPREETAGLGSHKETDSWAWTPALCPS